MSELEYKEVFAIELNDRKMMIASKEYYDTFDMSGIYSDWFDTKNNYTKYIAQDINEFLYHNIDAKFDEDLYNRIIDNVMSMLNEYQRSTTDNLCKMFVAINSNNSIDIKLLYENDYSEHITYNGSYSILWKE